MKELEEAVEALNKHDFKMISLEDMLDLLQMAKESSLEETSDEDEMNWAIKGAVNMCDQLIEYLKTNITETVLIRSVDSEDD